MRAHFDRPLATISALLVGGGAIIFFSAALGLLGKEGGFLSAIISQYVLGLGLGSLVLLTALVVPLEYLRRYALPLYVVALATMFLVYIPGVGLSLNGALRWIDLGFVTVQPSEFLKIAYVVYTAAWFARDKSRATTLVSGLVPPAIMTVLAGVLLLLQPDTDTFLILAATGVAMAFVSGMRFVHLVAVCGIAVVLVAGLVMVRPYLKDRIITYLNPASDTRGTGYQIDQSLIAVGSGGIVGRGFGASLQKFKYLPEATSDSIFAVYAEEFGFIGATLLVLLFLAFSLRGFWVAVHAKDMFRGLLILGFVLMISAQSFLNISAMLGIAPVGGLPLVFVSQGGTALLAALLAVGLILNASRI